MNIEISFATIHDHDSVNSIVKEGQDEHADALPHIFNKLDLVMPKYYFQELLNSPDSDVLIAKENGEVIGFAVMELCKSPLFDSLVPRIFGYMHDFGVKSSHQKRGIGKVLFNACVEWSQARGASYMDLNVYEFNQKAIAFYDSLGMETISHKMTLKI